MCCIKLFVNVFVIITIYCLYHSICRCAILYLSARQLVYFCTFVIQKKKIDPWKHVIKSYATIPTLHSPGKGGKPYSKKSQSIGQTKHNSGCTHFLIPCLLKLHVKIPNFFLILIYSESHRFHAIRYKIHPP